MGRSQLLALLLTAGTLHGSDCRFASGPDGFCAALRLDPTDAELRVGSSLVVRVNGLDCSGVQCVDCTGARRRIRWASSAPAVATVDSTGVIHAEREGAVEIRLEDEADPSALSARMRIVVSE